MSHARRMRRQAAKTGAPPAKPGGGRYDAIAERALSAAGARAVLLMVLDGKHGSGFTLQQVVGGSSPPITNAELADMLRYMADAIDAGEWGVTTAAPIPAPQGDA